MAENSTRRVTRHDLNQALSKAVAFHRVGKNDEARKWAQRLHELMERMFGEGEQR